MANWRVPYQPIFVYQAGALSGLLVHVGICPDVETGKEVAVGIIRSMAANVDSNTYVTKYYQLLSSLKKPIQEQPNTNNNNDYTDTNHTNDNNDTNVANCNDNVYSYNNNANIINNGGKQEVPVLGSFPFISYPPQNLSTVEDLPQLLLSSSSFPSPTPYCASFPSFSSPPCQIDFHDEWDRYAMELFPNLA